MLGQTRQNFGVCAVRAGHGESEVTYCLFAICTALVPRFEVFWGSVIGSAQLTEIGVHLLTLA